METFSLTVHAQEITSRRIVVFVLERVLNRNHVLLNQEIKWKLNPFQSAKNFKYCYFFEQAKNFYIGSAIEGLIKRIQK